jgi:hypothetical protein
VPSDFTVFGCPSTGPAPGSTGGRSGAGSHRAAKRRGVRLAGFSLTRANLVARLAR